MNKVRLYLFLIFILFICNVKCVKANETDVRFGEITNKLKDYVENDFDQDNIGSSCYDFSTNLEGNDKFTIDYIKSGDCLGPNDWSFTLELKDNVVFFNSYATLFDDNISYRDVLEIDKIFFEAFLEAVNLDLKYEDFEPSQLVGPFNGTVYKKDEAVYAYIGQYEYASVENGAYIGSYLNGFRYALSGKVYEIGEVTDKSVSININWIASSSYVCINSDCGSSPFKLSTDNKDFYDPYKDIKVVEHEKNIVIDNLTPNTTYYLKIDDGVNKAYNYTFKTLSDKQNIETDNDTANKDDSNTSNDVKDDLVENPKTGLNYAIMSLLLISIVVIIAIRIKKNYIHKI